MVAKAMGTTRHGFTADGAGRGWPSGAVETLAVSLRRGVLIVIVALDGIGKALSIVSWVLNTYAIIFRFISAAASMRNSPTGPRCSRRWSPLGTPAARLVPMYAAAGTLPVRRATTGSAMLNVSGQFGSAIGVYVLVALTANHTPLRGSTMSGSCKPASAWLPQPFSSPAAATELPT